jgi:hypothetical protein
MNSDAYACHWNDVVCRASTKRCSGKHPDPPSSITLWDTIIWFEVLRVEWTRRTTGSKNTCSHDSKARKPVQCGAVQASELEKSIKKCARRKMTKTGIVKVQVKMQMGTWRLSSASAVLCFANNFAKTKKIIVQGSLYGAISCARMNVHEVSWGCCLCRCTRDEEWLWWNDRLWEGEARRGEASTYITMQYAGKRDTQME